MNIYPISVHHDDPRPLRITAVMAEPVVTFGDGLHLDGAVAYGAFMSLPRPVRESMPPTSAPEALDFDLPLNRWHYEAPEGSAAGALDDEGRVWGWQCSAAHAVWQHHGTAEVRRRPPVQEMARYTDARTVQINCGPFKAQDKAFPTLWAPEIVWYAIGTPDSLRQLLEHVPGLGKLTGHGHGRVLRWDVAEVGCADADRWARRRLPTTAPGAVGWPARGAIRPPYYHASRVVPCIDPIYEDLAP